jgi:hypothetical protein
MPQERTVLAYDSDGRHGPFWSKRRIHWTVIALLPAVYICVWVWMAAYAGYRGNGITYQRYPDPALYQGLTGILFRPAYEVDRLLRPGYWQGTHPWAATRPAA